MTAPRKKVLFVCIGNSCRSQMAEAIARHVAADVIEATSAGLVPLGRIASPTAEVLREKGYSIEGQTSKALQRDAAEFDGLIINMTGIPGKSLFVGAQFEDWEVDDPFAEELAVHRRVRDEIERLVIDLAARLRKQSS
jgi:arsenate reductase (thioredoxin)